MAKKTKNKTRKQKKTLTIQSTGEDVKLLDYITGEKAKWDI